MIAFIGLNAGFCRANGWRPDLSNMAGSMMRRAMVILVLLAWPGVVWAQVGTRADSKPADVRPADVRQAKIEAATNNAVNALMADVQRQPITNNIAVRDFVSRTQSEDALMATLREADQIGGPRWIDESTCQIRLEIGGQKVANTLEKISDGAGDKSPVKPAALKRALNTWDRRSFSAVGTSENQAPPDANLAAPATRPAQIALPAIAPKWASEFMRADGQNGPAFSKLRSARAAEQKAIAALRAQVDQLPVTKDVTVGTLSANDADMKQAIDRAVQRAKLTKLDYLADGSAAVQVTADLADVWREIIASRQDVSPTFQH